ncbi:MAG: 4-alpha-glucanotransferase [Anaerolineae bacterium]|nr:4-alpha-glucanotransferase [Anaerolineae bacterium]
MEPNPFFPRSSGVLLHPTSLPGPYGIGDLGESTRRFLDYLAAADQRVWQVLPLGPTGFAESPYQCFSAFAGNTNLISLDALVDHGWLFPDDLADHPYFSPRKVNYAAVIQHHDELLSLAYDRFVIQDDPAQKDALAAWCAHPDRWWLDDYALFISLKEFHGGRPWTDWTDSEIFREKQALEAARKMHACRMAEHRFRQWVFYVQWQQVRQYAYERGIRIVGDIPIYVAHDSSDVWVNPELFDLDFNGRPNYIAGVPPDYFSSTGQRWGNPLYLWEEHRRTDYAWWVRRIQAMLDQVDIVRIDHFRAFDRYHKIPASSPTAQGGRWVNGPKKEFFEKLSKGLEKKLDELPIIAEDLGDDLGDAITLRKDLNLPGMIVLQFSFGGTEEDRERFHHALLEKNMVVYTGTHDNNTIFGWWWGESGPDDRARVRAYLGKEIIDEPHWELIEMGMKAEAHTFIVPLQDVIGAGNSARMNKPGVPSGQWCWRCTLDELDNAPWERLRKLTRRSKRAPA